MATDSFIIKDIRVFTGVDTIDNGWVYVKDGKIDSLGAGSAPGSISSDVKNYSKPSHTLLPGFIDSHIHAFGGEETGQRQSLGFGVTTVMDMHNETHNVAKLKKFAQENKTAGADFKSSGAAATIANGWPEAVVRKVAPPEHADAAVKHWPQLKDPSEAEGYVEDSIKGQSDYIKLMHESGGSLGFEVTKPSLELQKALIKAAHARGLKVVGHALAHQDAEELIDCGVNGTTHIFYDKPITEQLVQKWKASGAWCNPTLGGAGSLTGEGKEVQEKYANDERVQHLLLGDSKKVMCSCLHMKAETSKYEYAVGAVKALKAAGVPVIVGSDAAAPTLGTAYGLSFHYELKLFVDDAGFTPTEALHAGTALIADSFGFDDRGRIAEGLKADLLLVEGDPTKDIDTTLNLRGVWRDGLLADEYQGKV